MKDLMLAIVLAVTVFIILLFCGFLPNMNNTEKDVKIVTGNFYLREHISNAEDPFEIHQQEIPYLF